METREETAEDVYLSPAPVCPRLDGLSADQVALIRRQVAYAGAKADLERARQAAWAHLVARGLTVEGPRHA